MSANAELEVLLHGEHVGTLRRSRADIALAYTPRYLSSRTRVPLSLSLPLSAPMQGADDAQAARWIDGLLPGNRKVRDRWAAIHDADSSAPFDLLSTPVGHDCAGAVQFCPPGYLEAISARAGGVRWLSSEEFDGEIAKVVEDPDGWGASGQAEGFSLAGAYPKICLVAGADGRWGRPHGGAPSTHILKPAPEESVTLPINEFLALRTAEHAGVVVCDARLLFVGDHPVLAVTRFDRARSHDGSMARVHQEDAHQAAGGDRHMYQAHGGLAPAEIADVLRRHASSPARELEMFLSQLAYRWLVRDPDGHAKNYTLSLTAGDVRLAPLYDTWSLDVMAPGRDHEGRRPAMWPHDGTQNPDSDPVGYWKAMSKSLGLRSRTCAQAVRSIAERFSEASRQAAGELPDHPSVDEPAEQFLALAAKDRLPARSRRGAAPATKRGAAQQQRAPLPEPRPRCGARMPISKTWCALPEGHNGPHRSSKRR